MVAEDAVQEAAMFRGDLLEIASLLTQLQVHLAPEGLSNFEVPSAPAEAEHRGKRHSDTDGRNSETLLVTLQDLQDVLRYRELLKELHSTHNKLAIARNVGRAEKHFRPVGRYFAEQINKEMEEVKGRLKTCTERTQKIEILWTRLDVWWTKGLSQRLLLSPSSEFSDDPSKVVDCCSSPLLNLPGSLHFRKVIPEATDLGGSGPSSFAQEGSKPLSAFHENELPCCSLALPPNKHTWGAYARISQMVMQLEVKPSAGNDRRRKQKLPREVALKSPFCIHDAVTNQHKQYQLMLAKDFDFTPPHLIALWIRAQRNTQAMRHLWMLFKVFPKAPSLANARGQPSQSVEFAGNPSRARSRIVEMSRLVDKFVEWAVTNQVLFSHKNVQKHLITSSMRTTKRKRDVYVEQEQNSEKRVRRDLSANSEEAELRAAAIVFLLRWFAKRNRFVASFLFTSDRTRLLHDLVWTNSEKGATKDVGTEVFEVYKAYFFERASQEGSTINDQDWTLPRVEARLQFGANYGDKHHDINNLVVSSVRNQVVAMLDVLLDSASWTAAQDQQIRHAKDDIEALLEHFCGTPQDIYAGVSKLIVNASQKSAKEVTELLLSHPGPFSSMCYVCDDLRKETPLLTCANCERVFHGKTCSTNYAQLELCSIALVNEPFRKLFMLKQPNVERVPNYEVDDTVQWESITITINRDLKDNGEVDSIGLSLRPSKDCSKVFTRLSGPNATMFDLYKVHSQEEQSEHRILPVTGLDDGAIVFKTMNDGYGKRSGVLSGDVIVAIEHVEVPNPEFVDKVGELFEFSQLKTKERLSLLRVPSTQLKLHIRRPSRNIVQESRRWFDGLKLANCGFEAFSECRNMVLYVCAGCQLDPKTLIQDDIEMTILKEAGRCRALIRRIGQEQFAAPFLDETHSSLSPTTCESHGRFFSLRRLDAMMTSIIAKITYGNDDHRASLLSAAFMLPPEVESGDHRRRLHWAPERLEKEPLNLIFESLLAWCQVVEDGEARKKDKEKMLRMFMLLIPPWIILPRLSLEGPLTKGPPDIFLQVREPWLAPTCIFCAARPSSEGFVACETASCREFMRKDNEKIGEPKKVDSTVLLTNILTYNECSSLVGTTLLVPPSDPLVAALKRDVLPDLDHDNRPIEFVVASYLPAGLADSSLKVRPMNPFYDKFSEGEGIFHLFPVASTTQLKYVIERCSIRQKPSDSMDHGWVCIDVLNFNGVARYSFLELQKKVQVSGAIRRSMDLFIASQEKAASPLASLASCSREGRGLKDTCLVRSKRYILDTSISLQLVPKAILAALGDDKESSITNERESWELEFGNVELQEGFDAANATMTALNILEPEDQSCTLVYSDLYFLSPTDIPWLKDSLVPQQLTPPSTEALRYSEITVLLKRNSGAIRGAGYDGIGFGYELVRWKNQAGLMVGRVHKHSPASGVLRAGDKVVFAGGKSIDEIQSSSELVAVLLGAPLHLRMITSSQDHLRMALSTVKQSNIPLDSVVLTVHRPIDPVIVRQLAKQGTALHMDGSRSTLSLSKTLSMRDQVIGSSRQGGNGTRTDPIDLEFPHSERVANYQTMRASVVPTYPSAYLFGFSSNLANLWKLVNHTFATRAPVESSHLYQAAGAETILTLLECATFLEALAKEQPMLGVRLLCPRYRIELIDQEVTKMASWRQQDVQSIPRLSDNMYTVILREDYKRSIGKMKPETGPVIFIEGEYEYRRPVTVLPLDRLVERTLEEVQGGHQIRDQIALNRAMPNTQVFVGQHPQHPPGHGLYQDHSQASMNDTFDPLQIYAGGSVDQVTHFSTGGPAFRIRGGGPLLTQSQLTANFPELTDNLKGLENTGCINTVAMENWKNAAVFSVVEDEEGRETLVVGFIHCDSMLIGEDLPEVVDVKVHYVQKMGYIEPPQIYQLYPEDTFLIRTSLAPDEARAVFKKLQATGKAPKDVQDLPAQDFGVPTEELIRAASVGLMTFGNTPDGREVIWTSGDPKTLYIASKLSYKGLALNSADYARSIISKQNFTRTRFALHDTESRHFCPWGCSVIADGAEARDALFFESLSELHEHCVQYHTYEEAHESPLLIGDKEFARMSEGDKLMEFFSDVSASVFVHFPEAPVVDSNGSDCILQINKLSSGVDFVKSPTGTKVLLAWSDTARRKSTLSEAGNSKNRLLLNAVKMWSEVGSLFDPEVAGRFRFSQEQLDSIAPANYNDLGEFKMSTRHKSCQFRSCDINSSRRYQHCFLCCLPWEKCVGATPGNIIGHDSLGLGCELRSDIAFDKLPEDIDAAELSGDLGEAKQLLSRVASLIPKGLYLKDKVGEDDPLHGCRLWDDDNLDVWRAFVIDCTTPEMLSQAIVVLAGSIDKRKMPSWWSSDGGGWLSYQGTMSTSRMDMVFLQLYILDAALSETIGRSLLGEQSHDSSPKKPGKGKSATQQRMNKWLQLAKDLRIFKRVTGGHDSYCDYCDDGGELLCCEMCSNVAHSECCDPVIESEEITQDLKWICDSCINDICQRKGITRQNLEFS